MPLVASSGRDASSVPSAPFLIQLSAYVLPKQWRIAHIPALLHPRGRLGGSWVWISSVPATVAIWELNLRMKDFYFSDFFFCLHLPLFLLSLLKFQLYFNLNFSVALKSHNKVNIFMGYGVGRLGKREEKEGKMKTEKNLVPFLVIGDH